MINFRDITLADKTWMEPIYRKSSYRSEEYNFNSAYIWAEALCYRVAEMNGFLIQKSDSYNRPSYLYPPGEGDVKPVIEAMMQDAHDCGHGFLFFCILEEQCKLLEVLFPDTFQFWQNPDFDDYIYDAQSMITLSGKKLHSKRNHINRFKSEYRDWAYEPITPQNMPEVMAMSKEWLTTYDEPDNKTFQYEKIALDRALGDFFNLGMDGGLIRAQGRVVAFSMGDRLTDDIYLVHVEKAFIDVHGAYTLINQQFAEHNAANFTYINREDDSGDSGLRKAKLSYYPVMRAGKFAASLKLKDS
ncbi:MAG: phosphatidylglycerol lysyltransferase domain-containing protein [Oscillospiraceae bacterium]|nr:phosphatidylglycerol lysyltransferase domain-containing protein [Oscillospiraceae bacterium]